MSLMSSVTKPNFTVRLKTWCHFMKLHVSWNHLTLYKPHTIFLRSVRSAPVQPTANFLVLLPRRCFWGQSLHKASSIANRCTDALYWPLTGNQTFSTVPLFPTCSTFLLGLGVNPTATFQMRGTDFLFEKRRACCPKKKIDSIDSACLFVCQENGTLLALGLVTSVVKNLSTLSSKHLETTSFQTFSKTVCAIFVLAGGEKWFILLCKKGHDIVIHSVLCDLFCLIWHKLRKFVEDSLEIADGKSWQDLATDWLFPICQALPSSARALPSLAL